MSGLSDDLLHGINAIAEYTGLSPRRVRYLAQIGKLPHVKVGARIYCRKSALDKLFTVEIVFEDLDRAASTQAAE